MNLYDADRAAHMLVSHHLAGQGWRIRWNNNSGRLGVCKHRVKTLEFSALHFKHLSNEDAVDTILHEIAHALMGEGHGHSAAWKAKHVSIGGSGQRCYRTPDSVAEVTSKWKLVCQGCGVIIYRNRLSKGYQQNGCWHPACGKVKGQMTIIAQR